MWNIRFLATTIGPPVLALLIFFIFRFYVVLYFSLLLAVLGWYYFQSAATQTLLKKYILPVAVPLVIIGFIIGLLEYPRKTSFQGSVVSDEVRFTVNTEADLMGRLSSSEIKSSLSDASISASNVKIDLRHTTLTNLKALPSPADLKIQPLRNRSPGKNAYHRLRVLSPSDFEFVIKIKRGFGKNEANEKFRLRWDRHEGVNEPLRLDPQLIESVTVLAEEFEIHLRNCRVKFGDFDTEVGDDMRVIRGRIPSQIAPLTFNMGQKNQGETFNVQLTKSSRPTLATFKVNQNVIRNIEFIKIKSGKLDIEGDKIIELDKEYIANPRLDIAGAIADVDELRLDLDGFHSNFLGESRSIQINGRQKISNYFELLLRSNPVTAILLFLAYVVDKLLTLYTAKSWSGAKTK